MIVYQFLFALWFSIALALFFQSPELCLKLFRFRATLTTKFPIQEDA